MSRRSRGRRYDTEPKLNMKKVFAVIIAMLVIVMFVVGIRELLKDQDNIKDKTFITAYYAIYENEKWGVIDTKQNIIIEPSYDEMILVPDNSKPIFICMINTNYEEGTFETKVLDNNNKELYTNYDKVEVIYNQDESNNLWYENNVLKVQKEGKYGLINLEGKELVQCSYDDIKPVIGTKNVLITIKDGKQGIVDSHGNVIIENDYVEVNTLTDKYENGFVVKSEEDNFGIVNSNGEVVLETKYEEIKNVYGNNMYVVKEASKWKIVDEEENSYLEDAFEDVKQINSNNIVVKKDEKYGIVTTSGEVKVDYLYDDLEFIFTDTYIAKKDNKYGIININNEEKLEFAYTYINYEQEADFIRAQKEDSQTELLDREFNVKAEGIVSEINTDKNYIRVRVGEDYKYYNFKLEEKQSTEILNTNTIFLSKKDGKYGYVNEEGIVVVDYIYDDATEQNKYGYVAVKKDGKWGSLDQKGKVIVEPKYELENHFVIDFIGSWYLAEDINANYYTK